MFRTACKMQFICHSAPPKKICKLSLQNIYLIKPSTPLFLHRDRAIHKHPFTVSGVTQLKKLNQSQFGYFTKRWRSTDISAARINLEQQEIVTPRQEVELKAVRETTQEIESCITSGFEPKVVQPILFFLAIGASSFTLAAWMTMKDTENTLKLIKDERNLFQRFSIFIDEKLNVSFQRSNRGNKTAMWGNFSEAELRDIKTKMTFLNIVENHPALEDWTKKFVDRVGLPSYMVEKLFRAHFWARDFPRIRMLVKPDELTAPIPVVACLIVGFVTIKLSKKLKIGKGVYNFLRTNMKRKGYVNRLHTLTTSVLWQYSSLDILKYSIPILLFGSSYLQPSKYSSMECSKNCTAETTTLYHFIAFCIVSATFANTFSQILMHLLLRKAKNAGNRQLIATLLKQVTGSGLGGIAYALMATCASLFPSVIVYEHNRSSISILFILNEVRSVALIFLGRTYLHSTDHFARLGGALFGFIYARSGLWERVKQTCYRQDKQLLEIAKSEEMCLTFQQCGINTNNFTEMYREHFISV